MNPAPPVPAVPRLSRAHHARLMQVWRSSGWPHHDLLDLDLLAAGLVTTVWSEHSHESLRVTPAGIEWLAEARRTRRRSDGPHDRLAERVASKLMESGRLVWREIPLRARVELPAAEPPAVGAPTPGVWRMARPDVFSVRNTSVESYLHPIVHEVKVSRADLLGDLRNPAKRQAYAWLCCECYYVFPAKVAAVEEIPEAFGVWIVHGDAADGHLELARPARHSACSLPFAVWMALAKATPRRRDPEVQSQVDLGDDAPE